MKKIVVVESINDDTGMFCIDIMASESGKFSFKGFRRDQEDDSGWYPYGPQSDLIYGSYQEALDAAVRTISWLENFPSDHKS